MVMITMTKHQPWTGVAVFEDAGLAGQARSFLEGKGLEARAYDDKLFRYFLFLRPPRVTYRLQVRRPRLGEALALLEAALPEAMKRAIHCPSCDSLHVSYPQMTRKFMLPTVMLHLGILLRLIDHECYCEVCHYTWNLPKPEAVRPRRVAGHFPFLRHHHGRRI